MADGLSALEASGTMINAISVIGGGSRSQHWGQVLAAALNKPLIYRDGAVTGPAFGAARLARYNILGGDLKDMFAPPERIAEIEPAPQNVEILAPKYQKFQALYRALETQFAD